MKLAHENFIVCFAEISMIVSSKLVVAVNHVTNSLHHLFDSVHWADSIGVAIHYSKGNLTDVFNRDI